MTNTNSETFTVAGWAELSLSSSVEGNTYSDASDEAQAALRAELEEMVGESAAELFTIEHTHTERVDRK